MEIINLTPHTITFVDAENNVVREVPASGTLARLSTSTKIIGEVAGIPITETVFGEVEGLPSPETGKIYLVSSLVAQACNERVDVFIPAESVRDSEGRIIGCRSLGWI